MIKTGIFPKHSGHFWTEKCQYNKTENWKKYATDKMGKIPNVCYWYRSLKNGTDGNWEGATPRFLRHSQAFMIIKS